MPIRARNVWEREKPYWEWVCYQQGCEWLHRPMRNQSGDATCSMCGRERAFVGHFQPGASYDNNVRVTVLGKQIRTTTLQAFYYHGHGLLETEGGRIALKRTRLGD